MIAIPNQDPGDDFVALLTTGLAPLQEAVTAPLATDYSMAELAERILDLIRAGLRTEAENQPQDALALDDNDVASIQRAFTESCKEAPTPTLVRILLPMTVDHEDEEHRIWRRV